MKYLFIIPSFYGFISFSLFYLLYRIKLLPYRATYCEMDIICLFTILLFLFSFFCFYRYYRVTLNTISDGKPYPFMSLMIFFYVIGMLGYVLYFRECIGYFGSLNSFFINLVYSGSEIRKATGKVETQSIILTYFAWVASGVSIFYYLRGKLSFFWIICAILHWLLNLLFVARSRLFMILLMSCIIAIPILLQKKSLKSLLVKGVCISFFLIFIFNIIGIWVGKISFEGDSFSRDTILPPFLQSFYYYSTSGFAYLNELIGDDMYTGEPIRIFNPIYKLLNMMGITNVDIPDTILDFITVTSDGNVTNVGTFLEPFWSDGGILYVLIGVIVHSFFFDLLGCLYLKINNGISFYAWSFLCFTNLFICFAPRYNTMYFYIFLLLPFLLGRGIFAVK